MRNRGWVKFGHSQSTHRVWWGVREYEWTIWPDKAWVGSTCMVYVVHCMIGHVHVHDSTMYVHGLREAQWWMFCMASYWGPERERLLNLKQFCDRLWVCVPCSALPGSFAGKEGGLRWARYLAVCSGSSFTLENCAEWYRRLCIKHGTTQPTALGTTWVLPIG